jgi:hypothetical protein
LTVEQSGTALAEKLLRLPAEYQPVTVCVYWRDFNLGHHRPFEERGMRVVSAGHMFDPDFLFRFYHLCSLHRYASSNALGSHLFYSVKAGCSFFYLEGCEHAIHAEPEVLRRDSAGVSPHIDAQLKSLFATPRPTPTREQLDAVDYYLSADQLKSPGELRDLLRYADRLDRTFFLPTGNGRWHRPVVPTRYRRAVTTAFTRARAWASAARDHVRGAVQHRSA